MTDPKQIDLEEFLARGQAAQTAADRATAHYNGADYKPARDDVRLRPQTERIFDLIKGGEWVTLGWIATMTGDPQASISAQLRHLRKPRFGGHTVERRHAGGGLYEYRLVVNHGADR